jgi:hypothetical protein
MMMDLSWQALLLLCDDDDSVIINVLLVLSLCLCKMCVQRC